MAKLFTKLLAFGAFIFLSFPVYAIAPYTPSEEAKGLTIVNEVKDPTKEQMQALAVYYAWNYGVDFDLAKSIIDCESNWDLYADNPYSTASGIWEFIDGTWIYTMELMGLPATTSKSAYPISLEAGFFLLAREGTSHWEECL